MRFKLVILFFLPILVHAIPGYFEPWGKDTDLIYTPSQLYRARLGYANLDCVKAPGIDDRKRVHIVNIDPFAIVDPRELSRSPNSHNLSAHGITQEIKPKRSLAVKVAEQIILFHQHVLSPVDGPRSHFRPSSSSYMMQSMQKHGFIMGFLMGCDRLMRENSDNWVYRKIETEGKIFKYDPIR